MNLIRNPGFEKGNMDNWVMMSAGTLSASTTAPHRGSYEALIVSSGAGLEYMQSSDYVKINPHEVLIASAWVKSAAARSVRVYVIQYDEDLNQIGTIYLHPKTTTAAYQQLIGQFECVFDCAYIQVRLGISASVAGEAFYWDDVYVNVYNPNQGVWYEEIIADINNVGVNGNTADDRYDVRVFNTYSADIYVRGVAGVNPTLDVTVREVDAHAEFYEIASFAQKTVTGSERIALTGLTGKQIHISYVIGGTNPDFSFEVAINGKR